MNQGDELSFRLAGTAELPVVERITNEAYAGWVPVLGGPPLPMTEAYGPRIARDEIWVAEIGSTPLGLIVLEEQDDHLLIFSIAVSPAAQGRGIGKALLAFAEKRAATAKLRELRLYTNEKMTRNIALYESVGYRETGRRANPARPGWMLVDMAKLV